MPDVPASLYRDALLVLVERKSRHVTISYLQRRVRVGFGMVCRLAVELEARGVIGSRAEGGWAVLRSTEELRAEIDSDHQPAT